MTISVAIGLVFLLSGLPEPLHAEERAEKGDAILKPLEPYGGFIGKIEKGVRIWTDTEDTFQNVPDVLKGKGYVISTKYYSEALVEKQGYVYVITPTPLDENMQDRFSRSAAGRVIPYFAPNLIDQGFERMEDIPEFRISENVKEPVAVYRKYAGKGEIIKYGNPSWGVTVAGLPADYKPVDLNKFKVPDLNARKPNIYTKPMEEYMLAGRNFQGVVSIEVAPNGRIWASWAANNSGVYTEGAGNYVVLVTSGDKGRTWSEPYSMVIDPVYWPVAAFDSILWHDPSGRLWFFWSHRDRASNNYMYGLWAMVTEDSGSAHPKWSEPRYIGEGFLANKPTLLSTGEWFLPATNRGPRWGKLLYVSGDKGKTFSLLANITRAGIEPMVVERKNGDLWMLIRQNGISQVFSHDRGKTWSEQTFYREGTPARFYMGRLKSGRLLLIYHPAETASTKRRNKMTAYLSEDEGKT
ncbi:MAG TPA: sialidase family protein [bacterium]|nr:sialidase family protein [bacterium]